MSHQTHERATFWRVPEYGDMELLNATYITHKFPLHFHEEYVICLVERGRYKFNFEGNHQQVSAGTVVLVNPGEVHSGHALDEQGWSYRAFYPSVTTMRRIAREISGRDWDMPTFHRPCVIDPTLSQQLGILHRAMEFSKTRLLKDTLMREAMGLLIRKYASNQANKLQIRTNNRAVAIAQDYLQTHYAHDMSLDDIASEVHLSPYHFSRVFKEQVGLPPYKYLIQIRVQRAKILLTTGMSIADVAYEVGFADQSHLSKWFKRVVGIPPGQFTGL